MQKILERENRKNQENIVKCRLWEPGNLLDTKNSSIGKYIVEHRTGELGTCKTLKIKRINMQSNIDPEDLGT